MTPHASRAVTAHRFKLSLSLWQWAKMLSIRSCDAQDGQLASDLRRADLQKTQSRPRRVPPVGLLQPREVVLHPDRQGLDDASLRQKLFCSADGRALPAIEVGRKPTVVPSQLAQSVKIVAGVPGHDDDSRPVGIHAFNCTVQAFKWRVAKPPAARD